MAKFDWRLLFRTEKGKLKPTMMEDVEIQEDPAAPLNEELAREQDNLSLRLLRNVVVAAQISSATREKVAEQVALLSTGSP